MEKSRVPNLQNTIYTGIIVLIIIAVYFISGWNQRRQEASVTSVTPSPTESVEPKQSFEAVPEAVFLDILRGNGSFSVKESTEEKCSYALLLGKRETGQATLRYTLQEGRISSVTIVFPRRDKPPTKPKNAIEQALVDSYPEYIAAQNQAIQTILSSAISACDLNDLLIEPIQLKWYTGAITARDEDKEYEDAYLGCTFFSYPSSIAGDGILVCSFMVP